MREQTKKEIINRLHRIQGHLKRVEKMVNKDVYCVDILHQSLAVRRAIEETEAEILANHLHNCVSKAVRGKKIEREKAIAELLEIFRRTR